MADSQPADLYLSMCGAVLVLFAIGFISYNFLMKNDVTTVAVKKPTKTPSTLVQTSAPTLAPTVAPALAPTKIQTKTAEKNSKPLTPAASALALNHSNKFNPSLTLPPSNVRERPKQPVTEMNTPNEEQKPTEDTSTKDAAVAPAASLQEENDDEKEKTTTPTQQLY